MTTWLPQREVDAYRSVKSAVSILFLLGMIDTRHPGVPISSQDLAAIADEDARTVKTKLNSLCASGRVAKMGDGYILLEGGRALVLGMNPQIEALAQSPVIAQAQVTEAQAHSTPPPAPPQPLQGASRIEERNLERGEDTHIVCALKKKEEDSIILIDLDSSTSSELKSGENAQNVQSGVKALTTENILEASGMLFEGKGVVVHGLRLELIKPDYALACLAHAVAEGPNLRNPVGVAYNMLKFVNRPRRAYLAAPMFYLPNEFKEVFGMAVYPCPFDSECGGIAFTNRADYEAHMIEAHQFTKDGDPSNVEPEPIPMTDDPQAIALWEKVKGQLQKEMPPASFDTWVRDSAAASYDGHTLTVGARNAYARDWLDSRMKSTIERLAGCSVEFVSP